MDSKKLKENEITDVIDKFPKALENFLMEGKFNEALTLVNDFDSLVDSMQQDERFKSRFNNEVYSQFKQKILNQKQIIEKLIKNNNKS